MSCATAMGCLSCSGQPNVEKPKQCGKFKLENAQVGSGLPTRTKGFEKVTVCKKCGRWGQGGEKQGLLEKRGDFMCT